MNAPFIPYNQTEEEAAALKYHCCLAINIGGKDFNVYFDIETGDTPDEWVVSEGAKCFFKGVEITELFEGSEINEAIYAQSKEVEQQMADSWAEHMIDKYADADCD